MTSTTPRSVATIEPEIADLTTARDSASGQEKGKLTKQIKALVADKVAASKKRGKYADLDDRILALVQDPQINDAKAVAAALGDEAKGASWRLMMLTKQGKLPARHDRTFPPLTPPPALFFLTAPTSARRRARACGRGAGEGAGYQG